jgi:hypothetical protein
VKRRWRAKYGKMLARKREDLDARPPPMTHTKAIMINRIVRGFLGRCFFRKLMLDDEISKALMQRHVGATLLQSFVRGHLVRIRYPLIGLRSKSKITRQRRWFTVCKRRQEAISAGQYVYNRRNAISFSNLQIGDASRIALMDTVIVRIQCLWRRFVACKVKLIRVEEKKVRMAIRLQRWSVRTAKARLFIKAKQKCFEVIELRRLKNLSARRIQKLCLRAKYNVIMKRRLHKKWLGVRQMQRWARKLLARRRRKLSLYSQRLSVESASSGEYLCKKSLFYLMVECMWVGARKTKSLDVPHELQAYFLSLAGHSRMLDSIKFSKVAKSFKDFMDPVVMTSNQLDLQFSKIKSLTEKKIDYARFVGYLANLAAIKILNIDPVHINGLMPETPFTGVVHGLNLGPFHAKTAGAAGVGDGKNKKKGGGDKKAKENVDGNSGENAEGSENPSHNAEIKKKIDHYLVGRLRGKAALVVKFILTYLSPNTEANRVFQSLREKSAWNTAEMLLLKAVTKLQHFFVGRLGRLRYTKDRAYRGAQMTKEKRYIGATKFQSLVRGYLARQRTIPVAQQVYSKYLDDETKMNYWFNSRTQKAVWSKPRFLRDSDCGFPITIPPRDEQFLITCGYCDESNSTLYCSDCNEPYCAPCFSKFHKSGHRRHHVHLPLIPCIECEFQAGVRFCNSCKDCFCDSCYTVMHSKGRNRLHVFKWCHEVCQDCGNRAAQWKRVDERTGLPTNYCIVCYKDRFDGMDPSNAGPDTERVRFVGKTVLEFRAAEQNKRRESEKMASALKHKQMAEDKRRQVAAGLIQRVWRGRRAYGLIKEFLDERREFLHLREKEMHIRMGIWFRIRQMLGFPMHLKSDTILEKVHKLYPFYMHHILAACIENDWAMACQLMEAHEEGLKRGRAKVRTALTTCWNNNLT